MKRMVINLTFSECLSIIIFSEILKKSFLGKFFVENDTLVAFQSEEEAQKASADEDVNNKMFIVVRNLKTTSSKAVSYRFFNQIHE